MGYCCPFENSLHKQLYLLEELQELVAQAAVSAAAAAAADPPH